MNYHRCKYMFALLFVGMNLFGQSIGAQASNCTECTHRATLVTQLGAGNPDAPDISIFTRVGRLRDGRFVAGPVNRIKDVAVFSADGKFERMLGRAGAGPGEYRSPTNCGVFAGDSIWVYDTSLRRLSIFGPDLRFVRSIPFEDHRWLAFAPVGMITGYGDFPADKLRSGQSMHQYDAASGKHIRSYAGKEKVFNLTSDLRGVIGAVIPEPMRVVSFGADGARGREVNVQPAWAPFPSVPPRTRPGRPGTGDQAPSPPVIIEPFAGVNSVSIAPNGDYWILGAVPSAGWKKGINPYEPPPPERKGVRPINDPSLKVRALASWYDNIVEVITISTTGSSRTTARAKFAGAMPYVLGDGMFSSMTADSDGLVSINVWKLAPK